LGNWKLPVRTGWRETPSRVDHPCVSDALPTSITRQRRDDALHETESRASKKVSYRLTAAILKNSLPMAPIHVIVTILIAQIICYLTLDKLNLSAWRYLILALIMLVYIFVLPAYFIPDNPKTEPRCGMPELGITLAFWLFGGGTTLITHLTYSVMNKANKPEKE